MLSLRAPLRLAAALLLAAAVTFAQTSTSRITGTVVDATGAVVAGATVTASFAVTASPSTAAGTYPLTVRATGGGLTRSQVVDVVLTAATVTISASGDLVAPLAPGVTVPVDVRLTNSASTAVAVTALTVDAVATDSAGCPANENFTTAAYSDDEPIVVPADSTVFLSELGIDRVRWPTVTMLDTDFNQDGCRGARLDLRYGVESSG